MYLIKLRSYALRNSKVKITQNCNSFERIQSIKFSVMDSLSFYGGSRKPRIRFLDSVKDAVESQESDDLEIVILPPEATDQEKDSDEEGNNSVSNEEHLPEEVAGEVEIHKGIFEGDENESISRHSLWRKNDKVSLGSPEDSKYLMKF